MNILKRNTGIAAIATILAACGGADFQKTKSGAPFKVIGGKGEKIVEGNIVKFHLTQKIRDSVLSTTYGFFPKYEQVQATTASYDVRNIVMDALLHAKKGDSLYIVMSIDTFIKRDPAILQNTPFLKKGDQIISTIRVLDVFRTQQDAQRDVEKEQMAVFNKDPKVQTQKRKDEQVIQEYLNTKGIKAERTPWGAYIEMLQQGQGAKPQPGQYALIRYTGMDLTGKVFESNNKPNAPLMPLQVGSGGAIMGFEDAVRQLPKGSKARIYIPSVLAYGEMGSPPVIQPNQSLIFEIEVVDITSTPPQPQMPPTAADTGRR